MRLRAAAAIAVLAPALLLTACASSPTAPNSGAADTGSTVSQLPSASAPLVGPGVPPASSVAPAVPAAQLPSASGKFGEKPTFTFPSKDPVPSLQARVLVEGKGPVVKAKDWLVTNYDGIVWGGTEPFDNSYDRKSTTSFQIGVGKVVSGWDVGLVGQKVGSRIMLSLPPADGYGQAGQPPKIKGTDTLVFVIDIVDAIPSDRGGQANAKPVALPAGTPKVTGALGSKPTITIPKGTPEPKEQKTLPISIGTGPKLKATDSVLVQYTAVTWTGEPAGNTWPAPASASSSAPSSAAAPQQGGEGLQQIPNMTGSPFEKLAGTPVGSRVLMLIPASTNQSTQQANPAIAVVVDVVAKG